MVELPRKRVEPKKTWNSAKDYVLNALKERGEIKSTDLVKELIDRFNFKNISSGYGVINALVQHNQIHYSVMSKGGRMLYYGPQKGQTIVIREEGKDMPEVEPEEIRVQETSPEIANDEAPMRKRPEPIAPAPALPERPKEPVKKADENLNNLVRSINRQAAVDKAVKEVTLKTIKGTLYAIEQEIEASLSIENRAKLKLTYQLARASGYELKETDNVIEQIIALKALK